MANTYTLIASNTLSSAAASVTFSAIPGTYTDLVVRFSARDTVASVSSNGYILQLNGVDTNQSARVLYAQGTTASSYSSTKISTTGGQGASSTANTFGSFEFYVPNYALTTVKQVSALGVVETNAATAWQGVAAGLWNSATAVTSITLKYNGTADFVSGSSFFLYGIKATA